MKNYYRILLLTLLILLTGCASTTSAASAPSPTPAPTSTPAPAYPTLALAYSGTLTSSVTGHVFQLQMNTIQEDTATGDFTATFIMDGESFPLKGHIYLDKHVAMTVGGLSSTEFIPMIGDTQANGTMSGTATTTTTDTSGSPWTLSPAS